jgi:anti-sigma factor RsiW
MCCDDRQEQITLFIDGELSTRDQIELFKHLTNCPNCQSFINVMIRTREIQKREQINYSAEIDENLLSRLDSLRQTVNKEIQHTTPTQFAPTRRRITLSIPVAFGAAAATIIIGFLLGGFLYRGPATSTVTGNIPSQYPQPTAVIFYYSMPPVEVTSPAVMQTSIENKQRKF